jgi:DNA transformation protein
MTLSPEYRAYVIELFVPFGRVTARPVFGFTGLYAGEVMFGLVADERIYLKTNELSREDYKKEKSKALRFRLKPKGEIVSTSYFALPERFYDEPEELALWAQRAYEAAAMSPHSVKKRRKRITARSARQPARRRSRS